MRIAVVHSFYTGAQPSGENNVVLDQVAQLERAGHEVSLIARHTDDLSIGRAYPLRAALTVATGRGASPRRGAPETAPGRRARAQHVPQLGHCLVGRMGVAHCGNSAQLPPGLCRRDAIQRRSRVSGMPLPARRPRGPACVLPRITSGHPSPGDRVLPAWVASPHPQSRCTDDCPQPSSADVV